MRLTLVLLELYTRGLHLFYWDGGRVEIFRNLKMSITLTISASNE